MLPNQIEVITLFVEDIAAARAFYSAVFAPQIVYEDAVSAVLGLEGTMVNLLALSQAPGLVAPRQPGSREDGPRMLLTVRVDDVDAVCGKLMELGIALLNGPVDRPWGRRTAAFADPAGHVWEVAQVIG